MKYAMLAAWVQEYCHYTNQVSKVLVNPDQVVITFKNRDCLYFKHRSSDPILFFSKDDITISDASFGTLWSNLQNTELREIGISDQDRIIYFWLTGKDIYQKKTHYCLVYECMSPKANLILCTAEEGKLTIMDAIHKYTYADNPMRQVLPPLPYTAPQTNFMPVREEVNLPLSVAPADGLPVISCTTMNQYFEQYFRQVIEKRAEVQRLQNAKVYWQKELKKAQRKLSIQLAELADADKETVWLQYSELIKVNLGKINMGDEELTAINYYADGFPLLSIPLQRDKSPKANLQYYFKKYRKAKSGKLKIQEQLDKTRQNISQISHLLSQIESGYAPDVSGKSASGETAIASLKAADGLFRLNIDEDWEIVIGRKAKENDLISTQIGRPHDWWFHTRIYHGSHVLLRSFAKKIPTPALIELCCGLAAHFSKAKSSQNVPVDYTQIRYVRKPRKSAPGFVTYINQKTVFVDPIDVPAAKLIINGLITAPEVS
jgi:predicted ribosome quality control (RQC) complex YloA/Tae2 family protein